MNKLPLKYDYVVVNPPWLAAKPVGENDLRLGVCDEKGKMLTASLGLASTHVSKGRIGAQATGKGDRNPLRPVSTAWTARAYSGRFSFIVRSEDIREALLTIAGGHYHTQK